MRIEKMKNLRESDYVNLRIQMRNIAGYLRRCPALKSYESKTIRKESVNESNDY